MNNEIETILQNSSAKNIQYKDKKIVQKLKRHTVKYIYVYKIYIKKWLSSRAADPENTL